jgi:hypothetical protein
MNTKTFMHRSCLWAVLFLMCSYLAVGQESEKDTLYSGVLLIPFPSQMYLSDSDREIAEESQVSYDALRSKFRTGLDISFAVRLQELYGDHSLLRDTSDRAASDLNKLYRNAKYQYAFTPEKRAEMAAAEEEGNKGLAGLLGKKKKKEEEPKQEKSLFDSGSDKASASADEPGSYMHAELRDSTVLNDLFEVYGTELFLFLNQFEIDTRFDDCIDFDNKIYNREIKVHYDLYRFDGTLLDGGVLITTFPSSVNSVNEITRKYFPDMTESFGKKIPTRSTEASTAENQ